MSRITEQNNPGTEKKITGGFLEEQRDTEKLLFDIQYKYFPNSHRLKNVSCRICFIA